MKLNSITLTNHKAMQWVENVTNQQIHFLDSFSKLQRVGIEPIATIFVVLPVVVNIGYGESDAFFHFNPVDQNKRLVKVSFYYCNDGDIFSNILQ